MNGETKAVVKVAFWRRHKCGVFILGFGRAVVLFIFLKIDTSFVV